MDGIKFKILCRQKPDVARVDYEHKKHLCVTLFCVQNADKEPMPYTDKVIALIDYLRLDEQKFIKICNRIREKKIKNLAPHARI